MKRLYNGGHERVNVDWCWEEFIKSVESYEKHVIQYFGELMETLIFPQKATILVKNNESCF